MMANGNTELADLVVAAAAEINATASYFGSLNPNAAIHEAMAKKGSLASQVTDLIAADDEFGDLRQGWLQYGIGGHQITAQSLTIQLIRIAQKESDLHSTIRELKDFVASGMSGIEVFAPLAGLKVYGPVELNDELSLIPWSDVPEMEQKRRFGDEQPYYIDQPVIMRVRPNSAVLLKIPTHRILFPSAQDAANSNKQIGKRIFSGYADDVVRCGVTLMNGPVGAVGMWTSLTNRAAQLLMHKGYSYNADLFDNILVNASLDPRNTNEEQFRDLFSKFVTVSPSEKDVLRVAIDRLNSRRLGLVDRAIDVGIALEVIMLHDNSKDRGELKYRTAIRGAAFLGGISSERVANFNTIKEAYDLRSEAVHKGKLEDKKPGRRNAGMIIKDTSDLLLRIVDKIIKTGKFPRWEDYVLNIGFGD